MNMRKLGIALSLALSLALAWALTTLGARSQEPPGLQTIIRYVSAVGGVDSGDCTVPAHPCRTVQYAVDQASAGGEIRVAAGTYTDVRGRPAPPGYFHPHSYPPPYDIITQVVCITKTVTVRGGYTTAFTDPPDPDTNPTTLDAQGQGRVFCIVGDINPTIEGLRITGGNAYGLTGSGPWDWNTEDAGGGVYVLSATVTLRHNQVFSNTSDFRENDYTKGYGGGVFLRESNSMISDNTVTVNTAAFGGGLVLNRGAVVVSGNSITANTATHGGGLCLNKSEARIAGNNVTANTAEGLGGGLCSFGSDAFLSGNAIAGNTADDGGGLYFFSDTFALSDNAITANTATSRGGGLHVDFSTATLNSNVVAGNTTGDEGGGLYLSFCTAKLTSDVVADNQAGTGDGLYITASSSSLRHTTIANNNRGDGSGVYVSNGVEWDETLYYSTVTLTNTILVSHTVGISVTGGNSVAVNGILWYDTPVTISQASTATVTVQSQHWGDPAFVNPTVGDYHIGPGSAALDAGIASATGVWTDFDGQPRPYQLPDLGADEYWPPGVLKYIYLLLAWRHSSP